VGVNRTWYWRHMLYPDIPSVFTDVRLEKGFTRDVRNVGHFGTGDLEITIGSDDDLERAKPLIVKSYEEN
jgi:predicted transport protein